jgi:hypothetical protein
MKFLNDIKKANNNILDVKKLGFEITNTDLPLEVGETKYDPDAETYVTRITENDFLRHGQMEIVKVRNQTGSQIPKGTAVYVTGGIGNSPILLIAPANNNDIMQARRFIGVTTTAISNNNFGNVITSGVIEGLSLPTANWSVGDCAYITTNGQYTNQVPAKGLVTIRVGMVIRVGNNTGAILVFSRFQPFLGMLSDVEITNPQEKEVLTYEDGLWKNKNFEVTAEDVTYNGFEFNMFQENVQDAIDQIFFMLRAATLEYDGGFSNSNYNELENINAGASDITLEGIKQINGGES